MQNLKRHWNDCCRAFGKAEAVEERARPDEIHRMPIYWMRTADVYPDSRWHEPAFMAFDPDVRFPAFHRTDGDETIGNVHLIVGGSQGGQWHWSMTVSLPGPRYGRATNGTEASRGSAARRVVE